MNKVRLLELKEIIRRSEDCQSKIVSLTDFQDKIANKEFEIQFVVGGRQLFLPPDMIEMLKTHVLNFLKTDRIKLEEEWSVLDLGQATKPKGK